MENKIRNKKIYYNVEYMQIINSGYFGASDLLGGFISVSNFKAALAITV